MHAAVLSSLPRQPVPPPGAGEARPLWRLDQVGRHQVALLTLSEQAPSHENLVEQCGWAEPDRPGFEVRSYEPVLDRLIKGAEYGFRLVANPQRAVRTADSLRGARVAVRPLEDQMGWLLHRAAGWGFALVEGRAGEPDVRISDREERRFYRNSHRVTLQVARFDGRLRVEEVDAMRGALLGGCGSAKGYGCGLLTLAPLR